MSPREKGRSDVGRERVAELFEQGKRCPDDNKHSSLKVQGEDARRSRRETDRNGDASLFRGLEAPLRAMEFE